MIDLSTPTGRLNPLARGRATHERVRGNLRGHWLRKKRWNYWCASGERAFFAVTLADVDYLPLVVVTFLDVESGTWTEIARPYRVDLPDRVRGDLHLDRGAVAISLQERGPLTLLDVETRSLSASLAIDRSGEALHVVIPWSDDRYQLTCKAVALPVRGTVRHRGRSYSFEHACLDYGRGIWPHRARWQWAAAARDGVGFNLGGTWTSGTGMTENALYVGGRVHPIEEELAIDFDQAGVPVRFRNRCVDLTFTPKIVRAPGLDLGLVGARLRWGYGYFEGHVMLDEELVPIRSMLGFAEDMKATW